MKLMKLIPAALAVFALASCSTDELESINPVQEQNFASKGDLRISFDPLEGDVVDVTRAMAGRNFNGPQFVKNDMIFVYDEKMHSTDAYAFNDAEDKMAFYFAPQFEGDTKLITGDEIPAYGVFAGDVPKKEEGSAIVEKYPKGWVARNIPGTPTCVDITIPHVIQYKQDGNLYGFDIPAFGAASYNEGDDPYIKLDNFRFLTALLRVKLENAFGNATYLKLSNTNGKPLSGKLTAKLFKGADREKSQLEVVDEDYETFTELYIDLSNVPSTLSYVYIPVVAGLDGDTDNIRLEYTGQRNINDVASEEDEDGNPIVWSYIPGMQFPGIEFEAHHAYAGGYAFELADMSPKRVSDMLENYAASKSNININITNSFTIDKSDANLDQTIKLPKFDKKDMVVTVTLGEDFDVWSNTNNDGLYFEDADPENPFNGTIVFNIGEEATAAAGATVVDAGGIKVQVAEGTVILAGNYSEVGNGKFLSLQGGKFAWGDGTTPTIGVDGTNMKLYGSIGDKVKSITIADKAEMKYAGYLNLAGAKNETAEVIVNGKLDLDGNDINGGTATATITVGETGELNGGIFTLAGGEGYSKDKMATVTVAGKVKGTIEDGYDCFFTNVNISGYVDGTVYADDAVKGTVTITTTPAAATDQVITGDLWAKGDVKIALGAEGEAVAGTLQMWGSKKTITLVQGFVNAIYVDVQNAGDWEDRYINLKLNDENEGIAAFKSLKVNTTAKNDVRYTASLWDGQMITNSTYKATYTKYENKRAKEEAFLASPYEGKTDNAIFTASQLASLGDGLKNMRLLNDIDMAGAGKGKGKFESIGTLKGNFICFDHTISNLNLDGTKGFGLFNITETAATSIQDLKVKTVTATKTSIFTGLAALVNTAGGPITVKNVDVSGIDFKNTAAKFQQVGGIIGWGANTVTMESVKAAGTIDGYAYLGGLVGYLSGANSTFDKCDASGIAFKQSWDSGQAMDIDYARVGGFVGTVAAGKSVTIKDGVAPTDINFDKKAKMYTSDTAVGTGKFYNYNKEQTFIGFSGNNLTSYPRMAVSTINGATWCADAGWGGTDKTHGSMPVHNYLYTWPAH